MKLENVVPWGRSLEEYRGMFALSEADLQKSILGCADGPASFNAQLSAKGGNVVSADPIYQFSCSEIAQRIQEVYPTVLEQARACADDFIWESIKSPERLSEIRWEAMQTFLADYDKGVEQERYLGATLPFLPFEPKQFQLALCSHYLFLYSEHLDEVEHIKSVNELCRVADEVRIYPLIDLNGEPSAHVEGVMESLSHYGIQASLRAVSWQFQKGATHMMVLKSS